MIGSGRRTAIAQIDKCLESEGEAAYVRRTRLKRALHSSARLALLEGKGDAEVARLASSLQVTSRHLCNPSETFDDRWQDGWLIVQERLQELRRLLARDNPGTSRGG